MLHNRGVNKELTFSSAPSIEARQNTVLAPIKNTDLAIEPSRGTAKLAPSLHQRCREAKKGTTKLETMRVKTLDYVHGGIPLGVGSYIPVYTNAGRTFLISLHGVITCDETGVSRGEHGGVAF